MRILGVLLVLFVAVSCNDNTSSGKKGEEKQKLVENQYGYMCSEIDLLEEMNSILFQDCSDKNSDSTQLLSNDYLELEVPAHWTKYGLNFESSMQLGNIYPDSSTRSVMISVMPFDPMYMKKNKLVNYYKFISGKFQGHYTNFFIRNDLRGTATNRPYKWRVQLNVHNESNNQVYYIMFNINTPVKEEPSYCDYMHIVRSLKIKN